MTWIDELIAAQLRRPGGALGRFVMTRMLNRGNAQQIAGTLEVLDLQPGDDYLDLGFGGGASLRKAARVVTEGTLVGVDVSEDMVEVGKRRLRKLIRAGRLELALGDVAALPFEDDRFTKISTINTLYFWPAPAAGMAELARVLAPGGRLAVGFSGAAKMERYSPITRHDFTRYDPEEVAELLRGVSLEDVEVVALHGSVSRGDFVVQGEKLDQIEEGGV